MSGCRRRGGVALLASAVLCLVAGLALPGRADAAHGGLVQVAVNGAAFTAQPAGPLLDVNGLVPGTSTHAVLGVRSRLDSTSALRLRLIAVHDDDNGCTAPEAVVDHSCGLGKGELGAAITVELDVAAAPTGTYKRLWRGTAAQLARGIDTDLAVPAGAARWIRITATLPGSVGNTVQSDTFGFLTRVELSASSGVAGVTVGRPGSPSSGGAGVLALTGRSVILLAAGGVLLLAAGVLMLIGGLRRRPGSLDRR